LGILIEKLSSVGILKYQHVFTSQAGLPTNREVYLCVCHLGAPVGFPVYDNEAVAEKANITVIPANHALFTQTDEAVTG
jgi:hypothetical protein